MLKNAVYECRARQHLTQSELAEKVEVTRQTIGSIEKGEYAPSVTLALKIADVLQAPFTELFWLEKGDNNETI